jgi:hypothetical protein
VTDEASERQSMDRDGGVRITTGHLGTEIKWSVFSPCFASIFFVEEWLPNAQLPIVLRFYLSGWFEEFCSTKEQARNRIDQILSKSEIHLTRRTFVEEVDPKGKVLPPLLEQTWNSSIISPETAIDCVFDEQAQKFRVDRVGPRSTVAKFYGVSPVTYPYVNGGSYDDIVYEAYKHVLRSGKPRYDHVLAAMRMPDNIVRWVPYQRIIVPRTTRENVPLVSVVTEIAPVDIHPL